MHRHSRALFLPIAVVVALAAAGCEKHPTDGGPAASAAEAEKEPFGRMTVDELAAKMTDAKAGKLKLAVYDANHKDDYAKGHIPGAKWVKFDAVTAADLPPEKDATLVFYCANEH
ncbi:MAG TPA: rhodanese-like domain-containing protein [Minicystis sp.]|nr:rhodanese-like domain-containing protein [Minicystis sp.]